MDKESGIVLTAQQVIWIDNMLCVYGNLACYVEGTNLDNGTVAVTLDGRQYLLSKDGTAQELMRGTVQA